MIRSCRLVLAALFAAVVCSMPHASAGPPVPGDGDDFFIPAILRNDSLFSPTPTVSAIQSVIPLARQVCTAKEQGKSDLQAADVFYQGGGVKKLGLVTDSQAGEESTALAVARYAILAYCPRYNTTNY